VWRHAAECHVDGAEGQEACKADEPGSLHVPNRQDGPSLSMACCTCAQQAEGGPLLSLEEDPGRPKDMLADTLQF